MQVQKSREFSWKSEPQSFRIGWTVGDMMEDYKPASLPPVGDDEPPVGDEDVK